MLVGPVLLEGGHEVAHLPELAADVGRAQVELGGARPHVLVEAVTGDGHDGLDGGGHGGLALDGQVTAQDVGQEPQDQDGHDGSHDQGDDDGGDDGDHGPILPRGCDSDRLTVVSILGPSRRRLRPGVQSPWARRVATS